MSPPLSLQPPAEAPLLIALPGDREVDDEVPFDRFGQMYVHALTAAAHAAGVPLLAPLLLPTAADARQTAALLSLADGVLLTGSPSNVDPHRYGEVAGDGDGPLDAARDALTHALVHRALASGLPLLAVCRGLQEANVALGGSLVREVQQRPGMLDHRDLPGESLARAFSPRHRVRLRAEGALARWAGGTEVRVNSLHRQAIARLAPGACAEAWSDDGVVEAFTLPQARDFFVAVQWHPEAALSLALPDAAPALDARLLTAFVQAAQRRRAARTAPARPAAARAAAGVTP